MRVSTKLFILCTFIFNYTALAETKTIKIGSGSILEGYYSIGLTICEYISKSNKGTSCEVVSTNGSKENLQLLKSGKIDLALIQSNIAEDAFSGRGAYKDELPHLNLRQILNLHDEVFTVIAKDDDKIKVFADIAGKKISNGNPDSASTITYDAIKQFYSFAKPVDIELSAEQYAKELCDGNIDAIILVTGHPNALVNHIANNCEIDFVAIEKEKLSRLLESNKAYKKITLIKGIYPGITMDQDTIGVKAILITTEKFNDEILKNFEAYLSKNIQTFKQSDTLLHNLSDSYFFEDFILPKHEESNATKNLN
jgi:TRAP transporter TAXI family solute receptor